MKLMDLKQRRAEVVTNMRALIDEAEKAKRDLNSDEQKRFDDLKTEERSLTDQIGRAESVADAERRMNGTPVETAAANSDEAFTRLCQGASLTRAIRSFLPNSQEDAGLEIEISQELAARRGKAPVGILFPTELLFESRAGLTSGSGGNLVGTDYRPDLMVDRLRPALRVEALGATVLRDLVGDLDIPRLTTSASVNWVSEHSDATTSDHVFDKVNLTPKTVSALTEYSRRMLLQAVPAVENLVRADFANILATALDAAAIEGGGANEPTGILQTAGIGDVPVGVNGGPPTWDLVLDTVAKVEDADALAGSLGWLTNGKAVKKMRSTVRVASTDSRFIMEGPNELAGFALARTSQVPSDLTKGTGVNLSALIFGNFADLLIGYWSGVDILPNPYETSVYKKGGLLINAFLDCDVAVRHPESFAAIQDMDTV